MSSVHPRETEIRAWIGIGITALALAGVMAILLALSRVPGSQEVFPWPVKFFHKGLVIHVVFSFVVWFLCVFTSLVVAATPADVPGGRALGRPAIACAVVALVLLGAPAFLDRGEPSLNNYVPIIIDPIYYAGLAALATGVGAVCVRFWLGYDKDRPLVPLYRAMMAGTLIYFLAIACFLLAWLLNMEQPVSELFNEDVFWGGGHALQFLNTLLMITGWWLLVRPEGAANRTFGLATTLCVLPVVAMPFLYIMFSTNEGTLTNSFTMMQYLMAVPTVIGLVGLWRGGLGIDNREARLAVKLSVAVFLAGGFLGLFVDGADTRTPAHYHAVIAGVNLALIGLIYVRALPLIGCKAISGKAARFSLWGYGVGQFIASLGLYLAGGYGAPRKTAGDAQDLVGIGEKLGMSMNGVGGLIAVAGGLTFIWLVARALLRRTGDAS